MFHSRDAAYTSRSSRRFHAYEQEDKLWKGGLLGTLGIIEEWLRMLAAGKDDMTTCQYDVAESPCASATMM